MEVRKNPLSLMNDVIIDIEKLTEKTPLLSAQQPQVDSTSIPNTFFALPKELQLLIVDYLPRDALFTILPLVNKKFNYLAADFIKKNSAASLLWSSQAKMRFFHCKQKELNDVIEIEQDKISGCKSISLPLILGGACVCYDLFVGIKYRKDLTPAQIGVVIFFFVASMALILSSVAKIIKNRKANNKMETCIQDINTLEERINKESRNSLHLKKP